MPDPISQAKPARGLYGQRPSHSADTARRREFQRTAALSPRERMLLALRLGRRSRRFAVLLAGGRPAAPARTADR